MEQSPTSKNAGTITRVRSIPSQELRQTNDSERFVGNCVADFKLLCELGRGSYGVVNKVLSNIDNRIYVMKRINIKHVKQKHQKEALKEAQILRKVRHPNIIKYYTSFVDDEHLYIIMEYAEGGDLQVVIKQHRDKKQSFTEKEIWIFAWELCQAVEYLHTNNIIHRDIKTLNIFLTKDHRVKLGDLGVSKIVSSAASMQGTRVGTPLYLSPELVKQQPYDFKVDIWAVGCVLYHLTSLEPPFYGDNLITLGYNIVHKNPKPLSSAYSPRLSALIFKFLEKSASNRPRISEMYESFPSKLRMAKVTDSSPRPDKIEVVSSKSASILKSEFDGQSNSKPSLLKISETNSNKLNNGESNSASRREDKQRAGSPMRIRTDQKPSDSDVKNKSDGKDSHELKLTNSNIGDGVQLQDIAKGKKDDQSKSNRSKIQSKGNDELSLNSKDASSQHQIDKSHSVSKFNEFNNKKTIGNEDETTTEAKPRIVTARNDPQGNESTLSVRKVELTTVHNTSSRDDIQRKRNSLKSQNNHVIPEEHHERLHARENSDRSKPSRAKKDENQSSHIARNGSDVPADALQDVLNHPSKDATADAKNKANSQAEAKRAMINQLIKSTSPRNNFLNSKFSQIISLRNEKNFNIMKNGPPPSNAANDNNNSNLLADYRVRPVSAQVGSRPRRDNSKPLFNKEFRASSPENKGDEENDIFSDKDEQEDDNDDAFNNYDKFKSVAARPKSAMTNSRAVFVHREKPKHSFNDFLLEGKGQNLKLKDLLKNHISPKNRLDSQISTNSKLGSVSVVNEDDRERRDSNANMSQEKATTPSLRPQTTTTSEQARMRSTATTFNTRPKDVKTTTTDSDSQINTVRRNSIEFKEEPFRAYSYRQSIGGGSSNAAKPFAQTAAGFYKHSGSMIDNNNFTTNNANANDISKLLNKSSTTLQLGNLNPPASAQAKTQQSAEFKIRPVTSSGGRRKLTIKDLQL